MARRKARSRQRKQTKQSSPERTERATGRYTVVEKEEILRQVDSGRTQVAVGKQYGCHPITICRWLRARDESRRGGDRSGQSGLRGKSTRPIDARSPVTEAQRQLVLDAKAAHPEMGPAQLRNQLRRFHGVSLSHKTIGLILKQAGHQLEKRVGDREETTVERFEMTRPNELWTMDIKEFYIHDLKVYLFDIIDDYSRFVVGHGLFKEAGVEHAIEVVVRAIQAHGKPERVLTDRGLEFHAWNANSAFTTFLETEMIAHSLARPHHPQTCGKVEALHATLEKELIGLVRFDSFSHASREVAAYYERYNFERTHMGIGGVTPADRYFGRVAAVVAKLEQSLPPADRPADQHKLPGERAVVLQLALVDGKLELWLAGKRVVLG